jgi:hypothetical protein
LKIIDLTKKNTYNFYKINYFFAILQDKINLFLTFSNKLV